MKERESGSSLEIGIFLAASIIILVGLSFLNEEKIEEGTIITEESYFVKTTNAPDFPSSKEGIFSGIIQRQGVRIPEGTSILLFRSSKVRGIAISYNPAEQRLVAGTPIMIAESVQLFDGAVHQVVYSFQKGGKQQLKIDGKVVAERGFETKENFLTGLVTGPLKGAISTVWKEVSIS